MQNIQASLLPFHLHRKTIEVPSGLTLEQMVEYVFPRKIPGVDIVVNIGDHVIPKDKWRSIKPKEMTLVGINAVAAGGKGKKNPLAMIISIALIVAAPYIIGAIAPVAGAAVAAGTASFGQMVTVGLIKAGIGMVGMLATSMLSSVPKQRAPTGPTSPAEPNTQFIEGASNKIGRYDPIPVNLGVNRMWPNQAALPYTETVNSKQYVRQMFTYGFGKVQISDRRIGETLITEYDGVEMSDRLNADLAEGTPLYTNDVFQDGYSVLLTNATGYVTRTTQPNADEASIDVTFQQGLTRYSELGNRNTWTVEFEVQFAPTGTDEWTNGNSDVEIAEQVVAAAFPTAWNPTKSKRIGYGILALNLKTGVVTAISYDVNSSPNIPKDNIRIASFRTESTSTNGEGGGTANIYDLIDERASYIPAQILEAADFAFTYGGTGLNITVAAGTITAQTWKVTDATAQALRVSKELKFPTRGQYDIRIKRVSADNEDQKIRDEATMTAIRSIRYTDPVIQPDISGTAMRMLATDQLNGTVDSYNAIVATLKKDYDANLDVWVEDAITSNPASVYRYVLQSRAFVKRLPDMRINIEKLEEWHTFCKSKNLTYNKVVDATTSIDDLLNDIAAAGMATPHKINGIYGVLIDNERPDIKGMVTPRNSWGYNGSITYADLPHALRVQFRNKDAGYRTDERVVYADGYDEETAELYERLQFDSCTDSNLAWFYGRIYMATALLQPEVHSWNMDFENLTFNRGDKIVFVNDVILVGVGQGRIKELIYDDEDDPTEVVGFVLDEKVDIPTTDQFGVRIRYGDASGFLYHSLTTVVGQTDEFTFATPIPVEDAPPLDSLCAFTEFGKELELIITEIRMNKDHSASVIAVNYAPERFDAVIGEIPSFESNITLSSDYYRPSAPELGGIIQSDESVMLKNSDGSYTSRMLIPLINRNEPSLHVVVSARPVGATQWFRPNILSSTPEMVVITGLEDGSFYDFKISYQRRYGLQLVSAPLYLNNTKYEGASSLPADVTNFQVTSSDSTGLFQWDVAPDVDWSHFEMRFTRLTEGATWDTAQPVAENITTNRISLPIQAGTYLIKSFDILNNESENPTTIVSIDNGALNNVVELLAQQPTWSGTHDNTHTFGGELFLSDLSLPGYYYFDQFDLGDVYESVLSSSLIAFGTFYQRVRDIVSIRDTSSIRGVDGAIIRAATSIRNMGSIRGINPTDWAVRLEMRTSNDGSTWSAWVPFTVGKYIFRYLELRLYLKSFNPNVSPRVTTAEVLVDMPDRYESEENVACPPSGAIVAYAVAFRENPALNITLQNGATDDRLEFVYKTNEGFHVKVYNATTAGYVTRSLDYDAAGFGRVIT